MSSIAFGLFLGGLTTAGWGDVLTVLPYVAISAAVLLLHRRTLEQLRGHPLLIAPVAPQVELAAAQHQRLVAVVAFALGPDHRA